MFSAPETMLDSIPGTLMLTDCLEQCQTNDSCSSVNYETGLCILFSSNADKLPGKLSTHTTRHSISTSECWKSSSARILQLHSPAKRNETLENRVSSSWINKWIASGMRRRRKWNRFALAEGKSLVGKGTDFLAEIFSIVALETWDFRFARKRHSSDG